MTTLVIEGGEKVAFGEPARELRGDAAADIHTPSGEKRKRDVAREAPVAVDE
jgi:hypothetical protein